MAQDKKKRIQKNRDKQQQNILAAQGERVPGEVEKEGNILCFFFCVISSYSLCSSLTLSIASPEALWKLGQ